MWTCQVNLAVSVVEVVEVLEVDLYSYRVETGQFLILMPDGHVNA